MAPIVDAQSDPNTQTASAPTNAFQSQTPTPNPMQEAKLAFAPSIPDAVNYLKGNGYTIFAKTDANGNPVMNGVNDIYMMPKSFDGQDVDNQSVDKYGVPASPGLFGALAHSVLPTAGTMVGGGLGALGGTALGGIAGPIGASVGGFAGGSTGGGVGGALGETANQSIGKALYNNPNYPLDPDAILQAGEVGAVTGGIGDVMGQAFPKLSPIFKTSSEWTPENEAVYQNLLQKGMQPPADAGTSADKWLIASPAQKEAWGVVSPEEGSQAAQKFVDMLKEKKAEEAQSAAEPGSRANKGLQFLTQHGTTGGLSTLAQLMAQQLGKNQR